MTQDEFAAFCTLTGRLTIAQLAALSNRCDHLRDAQLRAQQPTPPAPVLAPGWELVSRCILRRNFFGIPGSPLLCLHGTMDVEGRWALTEELSVIFNGGEYPCDHQLHKVNGRVNTCWAEPQSLFSACKAAERALHNWFHRSRLMLERQVYPEGPKPRKVGGEVVHNNQLCVVIDYSTDSTGALQARVYNLATNARYWVPAAEVTPTSSKAPAPAGVDLPALAERAVDSLGLCNNDDEVCDD